MNYIMLQDQIRNKLPLVKKIVAFWKPALILIKKNKYKKIKLKLSIQSFEKIRRNAASHLIITWINFFDENPVLFTCT